MPKTIIKPPRPVINRAHPLAKGLVGCWPFFERGGTTLRDISGRNNNGTLTNMDPATDWVRTPRGYGLDFDGLDDYVNLGTWSPVKDNNFTFSVWINPSAIPAFGFMLIKGNDAAYNTYGLAITSTGNKVGLNVLISPNSVYAWSSDNSVQANTWYHVVGVFANGNMRLYLNGALAGTNTIAGTLISDTQSFWMASQDRAGTPHRFPGRIDEARVWNRALTAKEIVQDYADPFALYRFPKYRLGKAPSVITEDYGDFFSVMMP